MKVLAIFFGFFVVAMLGFAIFAITIVSDTEKQNSSPVVELYEKPFPIKSGMTLLQAETQLRGRTVTTGAERSFGTTLYRWNGADYVVFFEQDTAGVWRANRINKLKD